MDFKKYDIVIISYNTKELTINCIKSIYETADERLNKIIVFDNCSTDNTEVSIKEKYSKVQFVKSNDNGGYAKAINNAFLYTESEFVIFSNADVIFKPFSLNYLINAITENNNLYCVGPQQLYLNNNYQPSFGEFPSYKFAFKNLFLIHDFKNKLTIKSNSKLLYVDYVDGAVLCIRRSGFTKINGFDDSFLFFSEETDFQYRLSKEFKNSIALIPSSEVYHLRGGSFDLANLESNTKRMKLLGNSKVKFAKKNLNKTEGFLFLLSEKYRYTMLFILSLPKVLLNLISMEEAKLKIVLAQSITLNAKSKNEIINSL